MTECRWNALLLPLIILFLAGCRTTPVDRAAAMASAEPPPGPTSFELRTDPPGGTVHLLATGTRVAHGERQVLARGEHRFRAELAGYRSGFLTASVTAGSGRVIVVPLGPGYSPISIRSAPAGATLRLNGEVVGLTPATVELETGQHRVEVALRGFEHVEDAISVEPGMPLQLKYELTALPEASLSRGEEEPVARSPATRAVHKAPPDVHERLPGAKGSAARAEIELPVSGSDVLLDAGGLTPEQLADRRLLEALYGLMHPGETVTLYRRGWRTRLYRLPAQEMASFVARARLGFANPAPVDTPPGHLVTLTPEWATAQIAAELMASRDWAPLLDCAADRLPETGQRILRAASDGSITLIAQGGEQVRVSSAGAGVPLTDGIAHIAVGDRPVVVNWRRPPTRLIAAAQHNRLSSHQVGGEALLGREKRYIRLMDEAPVRGLVQFTRGPGIDGWLRQEITRPPRWGERIPLATVELGPHDHPGLYERIWVLTIVTDSGATQRQFRARYQVGEQTKVFQTHQFLRRENGGLGRVR